jgi:hypothetical protein
MDEVISSSTVPGTSLVSTKRLMVATMLVLTCVFAVLDVVLEAVPGWEQTSFLLDGLSFTFCLMVWCSADSRLHDFRLTPRFRWCIFLFAIIAFPIYAFKSRGRAGWRLLGLGLLFLAAMMAGSFALGWLTEFFMERYGSG